MRSALAFPTPLAEISANVFSAFLLVLIVFASLAEPAPRGADAAPDVVARTAPGAEGMVEMLHRRGDGLAAVEVFDDRAEFPATPGGPPRKFDAGGLPGGAEVVIFVFGHGAYSDTIRALRRRGLAFREMSVPVALRRPGGAGWSAAFEALSAERRDRAGFRQGLAALLAGGGGGGRFTAPPDPELARADGALAGVAAAGRALLRIGALLACAALVRAIEKEPRAPGPP